MLKNYFLTAVRIFLRQKTYSFINILGLSIGLASSLLIFIYVLDELSYDRYFTDSDKIFRVGENERFQGDEILYTDTGAPLAAAMRDEIQEVVTTVRITHFSNRLVRYKEKAFIEKRFFLADSNFFDFFGYPLIQGNSAQCLKGPSKIVITESTAKKYFDYKAGDDSPIGKLVDFGNGSQPAEVTGIVADLPHNSHLKFDMILSMDSWDYAAHDDCWACYNLHTYFKVNGAAALPAVEKKLSYFVDKKILPRIEKDLNLSHQQLLERGDKVSFFLQPLTSIHLQSHFGGEFEPNGDIRYVGIFGTIAIFIILIACINFMNLATARAASRAKEVGVRKTLGAIKSWLVQQFMIESFLYVLTASLFAGILVASMIHPFNLLTGKELNFDALTHPRIQAGIVLFVFMVGVITGSYPSFYLTAFKPVSVLKGKNPGGAQRSAFRNGLVVFQFAISMILIVSTLMIYEQLKFIQDQNLGFQKENILKISQTRSLGDHSQAFKNELLKHPEFTNASYEDQLPPYVSSASFMKPEETEQLFACSNSAVDNDHLKTMGYEMKCGRFFSRDFPSDSGAVIINETCARLLGYEKCEGKHVRFGTTGKWEVIGIIKDFNFESLRGRIKPLVLFRSEDPEMMALRITPGRVAEKVKLAESIWKEFAPDLPFQYSFVDEDFDALFHAERQMGRLFWVFTVLAIFIACLGLFGLITFTSGQRTKEIGIRKVMGATVNQIAFMLSKDLVRLVMVSFIIAIPITWYGTNQWLQSFAYRINFDFVLVLVAGLTGVLIAILTVSYKSYKSASRNPVESLRSE